ncbi:MAG TPA: hypothetical protein VEK39_00410 [Solirubrobacterales bacterium]|nr:hypothetical protein [Solirubrobacterales bacterium]
MSRSRTSPAAALVATAVLLSLTPPAPAATTIGQTSAGTRNCGEDPGTSVQVATGPASRSYAVPAGGGVITSWQHDVATDTPAPVDVRLKVFRRVGTTNNYVTIGQSAVETLVTGGLKTFATRIPVQGGDLLGFSQIELGRTRCAVGGAAGDQVAFSNDPDPALGGTFPFSPALEPLLVNVAATLEPDADGDGFGDETQDACPSEGDTQGACVPPETTITKGPKDKTKKKKASFEFSSSEPGSTFQCSVDGKPFAPCISPDAEKVGKGKHEFAVQAVDPGGTVDPTPAGDSWKVKRKRKKGK